jgi:hypothetical protein
MIYIVRHNCDDNLLGLFFAMKTIYLKKKMFLGKIIKIFIFEQKKMILFMKIGGMYWKNIIGYEVHYILEKISQWEIL